ncbi:Stb1p [Nakaseomyces bracarensis]|uniref:Stb1p n=1 Tax=Nakaseomyces bracarensis TaxID=273131 RepID=UPI0038711BE4
MLSRDREDELASKILERAQLAQMRRQLKIGLSRVPSNGEIELETREDHAGEGQEEDHESGSGRHKISPLKRRSGDSYQMRDSMNAMSPLKKVLLESDSARSAHVSAHTSAHPSANTSPMAAAKRFVRPSTPPRTAGRPVSVHGTAGESKLPTTPKLSNAQPFMANNVRKEDALTDKVPKTPNRGSSQKKQGNKSSTDDSTGADLLMYLATSPYSSARGQSGSYPRKGSISSTTMKIPTTPYTSMYMSHGLNQDANDDAVRYSALKASLNSPQSTFKVPHVVGGNGANGQWFPDILMDSPSLYLGSTLSPNQKKKFASPGPTSGGSALGTGTLPVPSTPSRELHHSTNPHLLKTPNFNMGDYLQIFSPSPRVNISELGNPHLGDMAQNTAVPVGPVETGSVQSSPTRVAGDA